MGRSKPQPEADIEEIKKEIAEGPQEDKDPVEEDLGKSLADLATGTNPDRIREIVTEAIAPYTERISSLEQRVTDLEQVVGQPEGAVTFLPAQGTNTGQGGKNPPQYTPDYSSQPLQVDDTPEYVRAEQEEDSDPTPWFR